MIAHIVFKDVNPYVYEITDDCRIYKNGEEINMADIIYHSTNGYDYVLLEQNHLENEEPKMKLYRLEFIMVSSFNPGLQNKWEWFKVNHIDGDIKNCRLDNLTWEEDVEEWRVIEYPETIKRNMYMVSSWGRFFSNNTMSVMSVRDHPSGYYYISLGHKNCLRAHRVVAEHFIKNPNKVVYDVINHIDGDKHNNHISNLDWVNLKMNSRHAILSGNIGENNLTSTDVNMIVELLLSPKISGSPIAVYRQIHDKFPHITIRDIRLIKQRVPSYISKCTLFDINKISFKNCIESRITDDEVDMIIEMLCDDKYNAAPSKIYDAIDHDRYPLITRCVINHIKCKSPQYIRKGSKYDLTNIKFKLCKP